MARVCPKLSSKIDTNILVEVESPDVMLSLGIYLASLVV